MRTTHLARTLRLTTHLVFVAIACLVLLASQTQAQSVSFNTSSISGGSFLVNFQLTNSNTLNNTVTLTNFNFGGGAVTGLPNVPMPGAPGGAPAGSATGTGSLPTSVTLSDASNDFLIDFRQGFTAGSFLSFNYNFTNNANLDDPFDTFTFAILRLNGAELPTTDSNGTNKLLIDDLGDGSSAATFQLQPTAVPEPATWLLISISLTGVATSVFKRRRARLESEM